MLTNSNLKKIICLSICSLFIFSLLTITVSADMGPKESVNIIFENMGDELCYATLLSKNQSTGPSSVWNGAVEDEYHNENERYPYAPIDRKIWKAFVEYKDSDGYYFLQNSVWQVNEKKNLTWGYYPPDSFKILLYYPEADKFVVSGICERYAFDTYYTVDMNGIDIGLVKYNEALSNNDRINAYRTYQWGREMLALFARSLITIAIEIGLALLFGFRGKKVILLITMINVITQIILNVLLNIISIVSGYSALVIGYIILEISIFAIESVIYSVRINKISAKARKPWFYVVYALVANTVSFGAGLVFVNILPSIF